MTSLFRTKLLMVTMLAAASLFSVNVHATEVNPLVTAPGTPQQDLINETQTPKRKPGLFETIVGYVLYFAADHNAPTANAHIEPKVKDKPDY